eukprot:5910989-Pyramimonas_sp.AAC.1
MKKTSLHVIHSDFKPGVARAIDAILVKHLPSSKCKPPFSADYCGDAAPGSQQWVFTEQFGQIGVTPFCVSD